jgi:hypothetical protein
MTRTDMTLVAKEHLHFIPWEGIAQRWMFGKWRIKRLWR